MKLLKTALAIAGLAAYVSMPAHAGSVYDWTLSAPGLSGTGTVTLGAVGGTDFGTGGFAATAATGAFSDLDDNGVNLSGVSVTGIWAPTAAKASQSITLDNVVWPSGGVPANFYGFVDSDGLGVTLSNGDDLALVLSGDSYTGRLYTSAFGVEQPYGNVTVELTPVSPVPLPPTWILLLAGFIGLGFCAHRGARKDSESGLAGFAAA